MCWSEQISPLAHSSQATWQPFNLGHCLEMHNTHLLGHAGQLSQTYFTHLAPILTPRNQPRLSTTMAAIARVPYVTSYSLQHQPKNVKRRYVRSISLYKYSLQVDNTIKSIRLCLSIISEMSNSQLFEMWFANLQPRNSYNFGETGRTCAKTFLFPVKMRRCLDDFSAESIVCCLAQRTIWQFCCMIIKI